MRRPYAAAAVVAALAVAAIVAISLRPATEEAPPLGEAVEKFVFAEDRPAAPDIAFTTADGARIALSDRRGKVLLVNLWATWCGPCVEEMPALDALQAAIGGDDFEVMAISSDRDGAEAVPPFMERYGIRHLAVYLDPRGEATRAFGVRGLPTSLLIDRDGRIVGRLEGPAEWDSDAARDLIGHYLAGPA